MHLKTVLTTNLRALVRANERLQNIEGRQPRMMIVHGSAGFGKTTSITWTCNQCDGLFIEAKELWTPRWMLSDFMHELSASPSARCQEMYEFIAESLIKNPRPIFIDEADRIARREILVETLRELHDLTTAPIILVGMDQFKAHAAKRKQLARRIVCEVEFKPATIEDARLLARELCEIEVHDDLVQELHRRSGGSVGLLRNALADAEVSARRAGTKVLQLKDFKREA